MLGAGRLGLDQRVRVPIQLVTHDVAHDKTVGDNLGCYSHTPIMLPVHSHTITHSLNLILSHSHP